MKKDSIRSFLEFFLLLSWAICVWYVIIFRSSRGLWFFSVLALGGFAFLGAIWLRSNKNIELPKPRPAKYPKSMWTGIVLAGLFVLILSFQVNAQIFSNMVGRLLVAVLFAGIGALVLTLNGSNQSIFLEFAALFLGYGIAYRIIGFLPDIQSGPFALGWSEGSRFYNASTFASEMLYGKQLHLPILHPSRYLMQALPFFVGIRDILAHRIWQVILWLGVTLWGSWLIARRVNRGFKLPVWLVTAFCWMFFFQGAVYYHLMFIAILVLIGYKREKPIQTLVFVILASVWAGISRINWIPVPGLLASVLYLIDEPINPKRWINYLVRPAAWTIVSLAVGLLSKQVYIQLSGENPALFDSALNSALLWYRLWPNATFFLGILPAITLTCLPLTAMVIGRIWSGVGKQVFWLRWVLLAGVLAAFFVGGVLVSLKIGGGGDLHNLDAFLLFFLLICLSILSNGIQTDSILDQETRQTNWQPVWLMLGLIIPVIFTIISIGDKQIAVGKNDNSDLTALNDAINLVVKEQGDVLFIAERQLLTFDSLDYKTVVQPYEKVFLMEMAMVENRPYLKEFWKLLETQTYSMIVTDTINVELQNNSRSFSEENNMWVQLVLMPILENYEPAFSLQGGGVNVLIPKGNPELLEKLKTVTD